MKKFSKMIRRFLALCLCAVLLCGAACAEEIHVVSTGAWDYLDYWFTLPDGRMVLTGTKTEVTDNYTSRGWVLCMNPDRTVSWEAVEGDESGNFSGDRAVLLADGTIAVLFDRYINEQNVVVVKTYTQDGQPTGKTFDIPGNVYPIGATSAWLMLCQPDKETDADETVVVDWDGKELLRYGGDGIPGGTGNPVGNADDLVLVGFDRTENSRAKIVKMDGLTDKVLWETTLDRQLPDTAGASLWSGIKTEDGGYLALMIEYGSDSETLPDEWNRFLVKVDAEGRVQRIDGEVFERESLTAYQVFSYGGKTGVYCQRKQGKSRDSFRPLVFCWFDAEGKELGTTEVNLDMEDFPSVRQYLDWEPDKMNPEPGVSVSSLIPAADGLWALASCYVSTTDSEGIPGTLVDSNVIVLIRVPELGE